MQSKSEDQARHAFRLAMLILVVGAYPTDAQTGVAPAESTEVSTDREVVVVRGRGGERVAALSFLGSRSYIGVQTMELTPELRRHFQIPEDVGVMIAKVGSETPAESAGLEVGDIVTAVDGESVTSQGRLIDLLGHREPGEVILLEFWRDGRLEQLEVELAERQRSMVDIRQFHGLGDAEHYTHVVPEIDYTRSLELDSTAFNEAIERLNEEMAKPQWQERYKVFHEHQTGLLERLRDLEERLRELEHQLEELPEDSE